MMVWTDDSITEQEDLAPQRPKVRPSLFEIALRHSVMVRRRRHRERVDQALIASTMLTAEFVGTTLVNRRPALSRGWRYSGIVRSCPPGPTSIIMSSIFPGCGALSSGRTSSMTNTRPAGA